MGKISKQQIRIPVSPTFYFEHKNNKALGNAISIIQFMSEVQRNPIFPCAYL